MVSFKESYSPNVNARDLFTAVVSRLFWLGAASEPRDSTIGGEDVDVAEVSHANAAFLT